MKITWIGHSCFKIESDGYMIIMDPYEDGYVPGLKPLRETADMVLCSHEHGDHNARDLVEIRKGSVCPFTVETIDTWHDEVKGAKRGPNTIHIIEAEGIRLAHLGDLGCELEENQIRKLEKLDVCLIPVGGHFTIDGKQAADLVHRIQPKLVIPMHYRDDRAGFGFDVISEVGDFTKCMDSVAALGDCSISTDRLPDARVVVLQPRDTRN
jgi:L-ascorbate metabolism protein UlaG (beta-lactamase superfamily)